MDLKTCSKCGTPKPLTEFGKNLDGRDGLRAQCRECRNAVQRALSDKRRAEKALWHRRAQGKPDHPGIITRKCPRCKEDKPWNEYPEMTRKNQGINFMCDECREKAEKARKAKVNKKGAKIRAKIRAKITKKRLAVDYWAKMKADAQSWRAYMKNTGRIWYGTIAEDAKQWREHDKKETQIQAKPNPYLEKERV